MLPRAELRKIPPTLSFREVGMGRNPSGRTGRTVTSSLILGIAFAVVALASLAAAATSAATPPRPGAPAPVAPKGRRVIQPFDFKGVTLDGGRLRAQFDQVKAEYLRIPVDDLLHGYRVRAGRPAPGVELGGWYTNDFGNVMPQIVSGLARMHAATGDAACRDKANTLIAEWAKCIDPTDGYFLYSRHPTSRQYFYEKMVGALVDVHLYCGNGEALGHLARITDYAVRTLNRDNVYANAVGDPRNPLCDAGEWYTVGESLYRAYLATGDVRYRDFATAWDYDEYWNLYAQKQDIHRTRANGQRTDSYHAYSHVNTMSSAAAAYLAKGDRRYLDALRNAYDYLQAEQVFATGGYGPDEDLMTRSRRLESLRTLPRHFENQCGSWAAFKMSKYLVSLTGEARYGDWVEKLVFNGIGAGPGMSPDGHVFYYSNYGVNGGVKGLHSDAYTCCTGTRPQAIADYYDQVFFRDASSLYVNLFTPATATWEMRGAPVTVSQKTWFPETLSTRLVVTTAKPARFAIKVRVPGWLAGPMTATLGGKPVRIEMDAKGWGVVDRTWNGGDVLEVALPAALRACPLERAQSYPTAIAYGPVVLAFRSPAGNPAAKVDLANLSKCLVPADGAPLNFRVASDPNILARPYYEFGLGERYYMYLDPTARRPAEQEIK